MFHSERQISWPACFPAFNLKLLVQFRLCWLLYSKILLLRGVLPQFAFSPFLCACVFLTQIAFKPRKKCKTTNTDTQQDAHVYSVHTVEQWKLVKTKNWVNWIRNWELLLDMKHTLPARDMSPGDAWNHFITQLAEQQWNTHKQIYL